MPTDRPNVLLVVADQHRGDWLGGDDVPVRTPNVASLADRGRRFTNAITPSPVCAPARACLAAGVEYPRSPVRGNAEDFPTDRETLYRRLREEAGYHTVTCGKADLHKNTYEWGTDGSFRLEEWGFSDGIDVAGKIDAKLAYVLDRHPSHPESLDDWGGQDEILNRIHDGAPPNDPYTAYLDERNLLEQFVTDGSDSGRPYVTQLPDYAYQDEWIGRRAMDLLCDLPRDDPWFFQINFHAPHSPFDVTREMHGWYRNPDVEFPLPEGPGADPDSGDHQGVRRNYAAKIELVDRWLGQYLARLDDRGDLDDTIVIYTSDHGELLGDHGSWGKAQPYQPSIGIPLVAAGPGIQTAEPCEAPVSLLDLYRTICEYAGLSVDAEGASLRPLLDSGITGPVTDRHCVHAALEDWELAFDGRFKLVEHDGDGTSPARRLYEVEGTADHERRVDEHRSVVDRLAGELEAYRSEP